MSTGMLVHEISVLVVILNAIRLVRFKEPRLDTELRALPATEHEVVHQ